MEKTHFQLGEDEILLSSSLPKTLSKLERKYPKKILFYYENYNYNSTPLKINKDFSIYRLQKLVLADCSARLVEVAELLSDLPFFCLIAVLCLPSAFSRFGPLGGIVLLRGTIQRSTDCSFHRLFDPLPLGLRVLEQRVEYVPLATRQVCLAELRL
uniref:Uncharacterized protein n=1 Tax=Solanum tuberosum TaxID=4113 RepID=M1DCE0_SOLTU